MITNRPTRDELIAACDRAIERWQEKHERRKTDWIVRYKNTRRGPFWRRRWPTAEEAEEAWIEHNTFYCGYCPTHHEVVVRSLRHRRKLLLGMPEDAVISIDSEWGRGDYPRVDAILFEELYGEPSDY